MLLRCDAICGGGVWEGTVPLALLSAGFQSLPPLPTIKLGSSSADSRVGGLVHTVGPCGSLQQTLLWGWEFLMPPQPLQVFSVRGFEALFPRTGNLGCTVCLTPQLFLPACLHTYVGQPTLPAATLPAQVLQPPPCCVSSPPQLPVSAPPTSLYECLFFNSLIVWQPHSLIFLAVLVIFCF